MEWLYNLVTLFVSKVLKIDPSGKIGGSIHFFIYDFIKIFILLTFLIFTVSYIQSFFTAERTKKTLGKFRGLWANTIAALLGTVTPFCSCSSIPLFIGFTNSGLPIGVTFSFLISSPLVDLASIILLASVFNWKISIAYVIIGIILAIIGGWFISILKLEKYVEPFVYNTKSIDIPEENMTSKDRIVFAKSQVTAIIHKVWLYVLIGVGIGAFIHNWIPQETILSLLGSQNFYAVPLATLVGIPIYADIFGTLPIAEALINKGAGLGTVMAFMMAVTALSLPSLVMLSKVVKLKLLIIFTSIVAAGIIIIGLLFNSFSYLLI